MSEAGQAPSATLPAPHEKSLLGWRILPGVALLFALLFLAVRANKGVYLGDEGVACVQAWRITQGQTPVADYFQIETPLSSYVLAGFFRILGPSLFASRMAGLAFGVLLLALAWWVSGLFLRNPGPRALVLALLIPFGVGAWPFASHHWAVDLCLLGVLGLLVRAAEGPRLAWAFLAGVCAAAGVLCMQDQGFYGLLLASLLAVPTLPAERRLRFAATWFSGIAVTALVAVGWLALQGATLSRMLADWVAFPLTRYGGLQGSMWEAGGGWGEILGVLSWQALVEAPVYLPLTLLSYGLLFALPMGAAVAGVACLRGRWFGTGKSLLLVAVAVAFLGAAAHRWALMNLVWALPAPAILAAAGLDRFWDDGRGAVRRAVRWSTGACLAVLVAFGGAGALRQSRAPSFPAEAPSGVLHTFDPAQAASMQAFFDAIRERVPEGAPAFMWGYIPMVNFLTGHPNPTRYTILITSPPYNSPEQVEDWIATLERDRVEWGFSHAFPLQPGDPISAYLHTAYRSAWSNGAFTLWQRRHP